MHSLILLFKFAACGIILGPFEEVASLPTNNSSLNCPLNITSEQEADNIQYLNFSSSDIPSIFKDYQSTTDYINFLNSLPGIEMSVLNYSYLGNPISSFKFGNGKKSAVYIGGTHAREWITPAAVTYLTWYLTGETRDAINLRGKFTFTMIPVLNVDGYEYSRTNDRMWRKNREPTINETCFGVDINRNYGFKFGGPGSSSNPCDEIYRGQHAYSTIEAGTVATMLKKLKPLVFFDIHSFSQSFIFPTGENNTKVKVLSDIKAATKLAEHSMRIFGTSYNISGDFDPASGSSDDDGYFSFGVKYSLTLELRDKGNHGFVLPPDQIIPQGIELVNGMKAFWNYAIQHP